MMTSDAKIPDRSNDGSPKVRGSAACCWWSSDDSPGLILIVPFLRTPDDGIGGSEELCMGVIDVLSHVPVSS